MASSFTHTLNITISGSESHNIWNEVYPAQLVVSRPYLLLVPVQRTNVREQVKDVVFDPCYLA